MNHTKASPADVRSERDGIIKGYLAHAILLVGLLSLMGTVWFLWKGKINKAEADTDIQLLLPPPEPKPLADGNAMGNPEAPVKIVEYSDFQCQYCRQFFLQTEPALIENYISSGKVYFVYRSLGDWLGPDSQIAAEAAYCASDQGKFWEYHDGLFTNQILMSFSNENLLRMASELGLDSDSFANCLNSNLYKPRVLQDLQDGIQAGVRGTPSFLINGKMIAGAQSYTVFRTEIDSILAGK